MARAKHEHEVKTFAHGTRFLIKLIEYSLPVILGGLELGELIREHGFLELPQVLQHAITNPALSTVLWRTALVIYFLSWMLGGESDTEMQADVYLTAPHGGRLTKLDIGAIVGLAVGFGILCYVSSKDYRWAAVALTGFWAFNVLVWRYMVGVLKGSIHQSYVNYGRSRRYIDMEKVRVAERYIDGNWQWWRFGVGAVLALAMDALVFFVDLPEGYAHGSILFFVVVVEAWIWWMRSRTKVSLNVLEDLSERYGEKLAVSA
jgi:hypothetical protein